MIVDFPTPYPDELLYSIFARYHVRSGNLSPKQTTEELFGTRNTRAVVDLQGNLGAFLNQLPYSTLTLDQIIEQYTLFPY